MYTYSVMIFVHNYEIRKKLIATCPNYTSTTDIRAADTINILGITVATKDLYVVDKPDGKSIFVVNAIIDNVNIYSDMKHEIEGFIGWYTTEEDMEEVESVEETEVPLNKCSSIW